MKEEGRVGRKEGWMEGMKDGRKERRTKKGKNEGRKEEIEGCNQVLDMYWFYTAHSVCQCFLAKTMHQKCYKILPVKRE